MHRILLSAMLLLPAGGFAQAQTAVDCGRVLGISNWTSDFSRGYWTNRVDLRNISQSRIAVSHGYRGAGAILSPAENLAPAGFTRRELARTSSRQMATELQAATTLTCMTVP